LQDDLIATAAEHDVTLPAVALPAAGLAATGNSEVLLRSTTHGAKEREVQAETIAREADRISDAADFLAFCDALRSNCVVVAAQVRERYEAEVTAATVAESIAASVARASRRARAAERDLLQRELQESRLETVSQAHQVDKDRGIELQRCIDTATNRRHEFASHVTSVRSATFEKERGIMACAAAWRAEHKAAESYALALSRERHEEHQEWRKELRAEVSKCEADCSAAEERARDSDAWMEHLEHKAQTDVTEAHVCSIAKSDVVTNRDKMDREWRARVLDIEHEISAVNEESEMHDTEHTEFCQMMSAVASEDEGQDETLLEEIADMASAFRALQRKHSVAMEALSKIQWYVLGDGLGPNSLYGEGGSNAELLDVASNSSSTVTPFGPVAPSSVGTETPQHRFRP
jgi:hypothetical protein